MRLNTTSGICGIDKASRGVQASLARRDGYGPLIPWAEATRLPSNHRFAVAQDVQTPSQPFGLEGFVFERTLRTGLSGPGRADRVVGQ
jgi:hypothetical protein